MEIESSVELFNKKQFVKQKIRNLGITDLDYDSQLVVALPALFPKITSLVWNNGYSSRIRINDLNRSIFFSSSDTMERYRVSCRLYASFECHQSFTSIYPLRQVDSLASSTSWYKNCRSPWSRTARFTARVDQGYKQRAIIPTFVTQQNINQTCGHGRTAQQVTSIESLTLDTVSLYPNDNITSDIADISMKSLESFSLLHFDMVRLGDPTLDTISNWISYIGAGYRNLQELTLDCSYYEDDILGNRQTILESLTAAMTNLK